MPRGISRRLDAAAIGKQMLAAAGLNPYIGVAPHPSGAEWERPMPKKRKNETEEERNERLEKTEQKDRQDGDKEGDALDEMVRKSIDLHGP